MAQLGTTIILNPLSLIGTVYTVSLDTDNPSKRGTFFQSILTGAYHNRAGADTVGFEIKGRDINSTGYLIGLSTRNNIPEEKTFREETFLKCHNLLIVFYELLNGETQFKVVGVGFYVGLDKDYFCTPFNTKFPLGSKRKSLHANKGHFFKFFKTVTVFGVGYGSTNHSFNGSK